MNQLIENILNEKELNSSLRALGDLLREPANREAPELQQNLPALVNKFDKLITKDDTENENESDQDIYNQSYRELYNDTTRVVVNLLANSDTNRDFFTKDTTAINQFWLNVLTNCERVGILLSQFWYETERKQQYLEYFQQLNIKDKLYGLIEEDYVDEAADLFDAILELLDGQLLQENDCRFIKKCTNYLIHCDEEIASTICELLGMLEPGIDSFETIVDIIPRIENDRQSVKRKLFVLISELSTSECLLKAIGQLWNKDKYVNAGCFIAIGNEITSEESYKQVINKIQSNMSMADFFMSFFRDEFFDMVQIQAVHSLTKILNKDNVKYVLNHQFVLDQMTKLALDQANYYQEVTNLQIRFLKKIINLDQEVAKRLDSIWEVVGEYDNTQEIQYSLLQTVDEHSPLMPKLIQNAVSPIPSTISIEVILEKLKAIAVLNQMVEDKKISPYVEHTKELTEFLRQLLPQLDLQDNSETGMKQVLVNNTKYVAATTYKVFNPEKAEDLLAVCQEIIAGGGK
ncbi:uncharacterized protein SPAPADRAFT_156075 [Spathaspora passalidarum NRRL Y-27907]|uniref:Uncharacterized protein n=1 Tax=Spathaspora passalidarum (strain NRRL Y-27907 / 11-Y1) TaxID=619300 RepID=G3AT43_SPAPN|nr:uncharacterized protein SPAPADRAFT_156075 [Spathaspora passalidarum NRRL Y-27907]EGW30806.1 hypothetical protein SPAPADRAFT_156075 [Spathaspora passalidarum NRRL Y-27907]